MTKHLGDDVRDNLPAVLPFVRFSCGCIGFAPNAQGQAIIIISCCDGGAESNELGLGLRDMWGKDYEPLDAGRKVDLFYELRRLINHGYRLREVQRLLIDHS
jgi:hypothetical protein